MKNLTISNKKQKLIDEFLKTELQVGERIFVKRKYLSKWTADEKSDKVDTCKIISINKDDNTIVVVKDDYQEKITIDINKVDSRYLFEIGEYPFESDTYKSIRFSAYCLESIIFNLNIIGEKRGNDGLRGKTIMNNKVVEELNWNPFIYNKNGEKEYYQRDFCWSIKDNQLLIESIYQGIECGRILVRKRSWEFLENLAFETGETELGFNDIVDGKQRLNAIRGFLLNEYKDIDGNYYADLSAKGQHHFLDHQLFSYAEMDEKATDRQVIKQFLKLNFAGKPQSKEHLDFVKSINNRL